LQTVLTVPASMVTI